MQVKKCYTIILIVLFLSINLFAQNPEAGTITGTIIDESNKTPLQFVNVTLRNQTDSAIVTGEVTDKNGKYLLSNIPDGEYLIKFTLIGYKEKMLPPFKLYSQHKKLNLGAITLTATTVDLEEVLVTAKKTAFENSIDRKVFNVDQDMMSKSQSASELLQKIPSVEVDIDGNVSLRGSSNIMILINGNNSPLMGKSRATVLQQMPASSIEKIELITNPSAKYKPDGTAGIINLVLKKNTGTGLNGSVAGNVGNKNRHNANVRINYNPGSFNLFGSYSIRKDNRNRINTDTRDQTDSNSVLNYYNEELLSYASPLSHMVAMGLDYNLNESDAFGISGNYFYNSFTRIEHSKKVLQNSIRATTSDYNRNRVDYEYEKESSITFYMQHNFPKEDHKLRLEFIASQSPEQEDNRYSNVYLFPATPTQYDNTLIYQGNKQKQLTIEYTNPISENSNLEAGFAGEFNNNDLDFHAENFDTTQQKFVKDVAKTNRFLFDESIDALYVTYEHSFGKFGLLGGLRAEQASTKSNLVTLDSTVTNNYFNIYPTLHLSYKFSEAAELQLNYSRRTRRPEGDDLNPFPEYRDARNISAGNPKLLPEYIHSYELGCKLENDYITILPTVYYRYTYNRFTSVTQAVNDSTLLTTKKNLSNDQSTGMEVIVSASTDDIFTSHLSANVFYNKIDASNLGYSKNKSITSWSGALTFELNITKTSMLQMNSNYSSARLTPQGKYFPSYVVNMGVRQELFDGKLSLTLTVADLFKTLKRKIELNTPLLNQTVVNARDSRIIYFGFTYYFGTMNKKSKDKSLRYDDSL